MRIIIDELSTYCISSVPCDLDEAKLKFKELEAISELYFGIVLGWKNPFYFAENAGAGYVSNYWIDFWFLCEQQWAEQFKFNVYYGSDWSCDCGSSTCDECNPGWDQEPEEWEIEEPDYDF